MSIGEVSDWLLHHAVVMLRIHGLLPLSLDHLYVFPHLMYFLLLFFLLLLDIVDGLLVMCLKDLLLCAYLLLLLLMLLDLPLLHALEVLIEETPALLLAGLPLEEMFFSRSFTFVFYDKLFKGLWWNKLIFLQVFQDLLSLFCALVLKS